MLAIPSFTSSPYQDWNDHMAFVFPATRSLTTRVVGVAASRQMLATGQKRSMSTWIPSKVDPSKNQYMQWQAEYVAKATGTTYVSPSKLNNMSHDERMDLLTKEKTYVFAEQADVNKMHIWDKSTIEQHGAVVLVKRIIGADKSPGHPPYGMTAGAQDEKNQRLLLEKSPGIYMLCCHGSASAKALSEYFSGVQITGFNAKLEISRDGIKLVNAYQDPKTGETSYIPIPGDSIADQVKSYLDGEELDRSKDPTSLGELALILRKE
jgi:hypothetical protein